MTTAGSYWIFAVMPNAPSAFNADSGTSTSVPVSPDAFGRTRVIGSGVTVNDPFCTDDGIWPSLTDAPVIVRLDVWPAVPVTWN